MKIPLIEVKQPIGTFYVSSLPAELIAKACEIKQRQYSNFFSAAGIQRGLSTTRVGNIAKYTEDPDATFPTPIIIAVYASESTILKDGFLDFDETKMFGEIIDGQHRVQGLKASTHIRDFDLPVTLMFDLTEEEKAYVFSIINSKQTPVNKSLIYDLFNLSEHRSPQKTCHEIARLFNSAEGSPFYRKLKMLGRKETAEASLSQGSFVKYLLPNISRKPDDDLIASKKGKTPIPDESLPLRHYFISNKDEDIYQILQNYFTAFKDTFPKEWDSSAYVLTKTTGYGALMSALNEIVKRGITEKKLSYEYFSHVASKFKLQLEADGKALTSEFFKSNESEQTRLARYIVSSQGNG